MGIMQRTPNRDLRRAASPSDVRGPQHAFYGSTADFSEAALAAFADAFLEGELTAHVKPEPDYSAGGGEGGDEGGEDGDEGGDDEGDDKEEM